MQTKDVSQAVAAALKMGTNGGIGGWVRKYWSQITTITAVLFIFVMWLISIERKVDSVADPTKAIEALAEKVEANTRYRQEVTSDTAKENRTRIFATYATDEEAKEWIAEALKTAAKDSKSKIKDHEKEDH